MDSPDSPEFDPQATGGPEGDRHAEFVRLFARSHNRILGFVLAFVHDRAAAEEVFQETSLILWRDFDKFRPEEDFLRWANGISFNQIRRWRRMRRRDRGLIFSDAMLEQLASDHQAMVTELDRRAVALAECLAKLREPDRKLVESYYGQGATARDVAAVSGRSIFAIRKAIHRIRGVLLECVDRRMARGA